MGEHDIQAAIVSLLRMSGWKTVCTDMSIGSIFLGKQQKKRMAFFNYIKRQGFTKGQSDIIVTNGEAVLFLEVKTEKGRLTKEQKEFLDFVPNGHIVRNINDVRILMDKYKKM